MKNLSKSEVDQISITILMDNTTDLLLTNSRHAVRPPLVRNERIALPAPVAEHGFSALVSISKHEQNVDCSYLFDTGVSENGVIHNASVFGIDFGNIDGIILSHGHFDHFTGLINILKGISSSRKTTSSIDIFTHPDAFQRRWAIYPDGKRARFPILYEQQLRQLDYLVPCHCTGWKATSRIIETMPEKFMQSGVGTTFEF